jgi:hypothetical protein
MNDISATPAINDGQATADAAADSMFYVVSRRKLAILFITTFGLYGLYWFYKNWDQYRNHARWESQGRPSIWPIPRAVFLVFFIHSLFREVKAFGRDKPQVAQWNNDLHAWLMIGLYVGLNVLDRLTSKSIGSPYTDLLSFTGMVVLLFAFLKAQAMINVSCDDPDGKGNAQLTKANYVWILLGGLVIGVLFIQGFVSGWSDGYSSSPSF